MNYYRCPTCYSTFSEIDLIEFKCSENYVGSELSLICPKCLKRRSGKVLSRLRKVECNTEESKLEDINARCIELLGDLEELKF